MLQNQWRPPSNYGNMSPHYGGYNTPQRGGYNNQHGGYNNQQSSYNNQQGGGSWRGGGGGGHQRSHSDRRSFDQQGYQQNDQVWPCFSKTFYSNFELHRIFLTIENILSLMYRVSKRHSLQFLSWPHAKYNKMSFVFCQNIFSKLNFYFRVIFNQCKRANLCNFELTLLYFSLTLLRTFSSLITFVYFL